MLQLSGFPSSLDYDLVDIRYIINKNSSRGWVVIVGVKYPAICLKVYSVEGLLNKHFDYLCHWLRRDKLLAGLNTLEDPAALGSTERDCLLSSPT